MHKHLRYTYKQNEGLSHCIHSKKLNTLTSKYQLVHRHPKIYQVTERVMLQNTWRGKAKTNISTS